MRLRHSIALAAALGLTLAACSGTSASVHNGANSTTLAVAINAAYPPFESVQNGQIVGYDPDILQSIIKQSGMKAKLIDTDLGGIIPGLQSHRYDMALSAITITESRAKQVIFTQPYATATLGFMVDPTVTATSPTDMADVLIATQTASSGQLAVTAWSKAGHDLNHVSYFQDMSGAYAAIEAKRVHAVLDTVPAELVFMKSHPGYRIVNGFGPDAFMGIAFDKSQTGLCKKIDAIITTMKSDGELEALQKKWFGGSFDKLPAQPPSFATHC